ncbi:MAG TPA: efflux RND transporter periplasmic adaptor subunit [Gemmatimonadaceae bacterium]|jgi:multidrug efflux pump subunit AcrA (membrane-fusion protein)
MKYATLRPAVLCFALLAGCSGKQGSPQRPPDSAAAASDSGTGLADVTRSATGDSAALEATPVTMMTVTRGNLALMVSGPGRTDALDVQKVRAPFIGILDSLDVVVGDRVQGGQIIGAVVGQASQAALAGAEVMLRSATTPTQRLDAERALELARRNLIQAPLHAPRAGVVISRGASQGDLVSQADSIVSIASANSIVFIARIAQSELARVHAGQRATIDAPGLAVQPEGTVHGLLPADTSAMSVPVRIDLRSSGVVPIGIFGTAHITVGERRDVSIVPVTALLRDDINGTSRVAIVTAGNRTHWIDVSVGIQQGRNVEITSPPLAPGTRVIVSGQVGLPEGSRVRQTARDSAP